jgi:hypothetical protein
MVFGSHSDFLTDFYNHSEIQTWDALLTVANGCFLFLYVLQMKWRSVSEVSRLPFMVRFARSARESSLYKKNVGMQFTS